MLCTVVAVGRDEDLNLTIRLRGVEHATRVADRLLIEAGELGLFASSRWNRDGTPRNVLLRRPGAALPIVGVNFERRDG